MSINSDPSNTWKADECLLTKAHPKYNKDKCEYQQDTYLEHN